MNERTEELIGKAWEKAGKEVSEEDWHTYVHDEIFNVKLIELVVDECFRVAMIESKGHMNPDWLMKRMKERVGVEE